MKAVYVIAEEGGPHKIGLAADPERRLAGLQTAHPKRLALVFSATSACAERAERIAHAALSHCRMAGEWFAVPADEAIAVVRAAIGEAEREAAAIPTFAAITRLWPKRVALARDLGTYDGLVQQWALRDFIPCEWWLALIVAAERRGIEGVTLEALANLAEAKRLAAPSKAESEAA